MRANRDDIIYSINVADLQTVSMEVLERELTDTEIMLIRKSVEDSIEWFDAVESAILKHIDQ